MDDWFEDIVVDVLWKGLKDAYAEVAEAAHDPVQEALDDLTAGKKLSSSPLVQVLEVTAGTPPDHGTATIVIRGRRSFFKKTVSPFVRIQVVISRTVAPDLQPPIRILDWQTVVGDLKIEKAKVFVGELGFGFDRDHWLGRGTLKIEPAGFGLDIMLGGLNDRGLMLGIDLRLPVPIPLGPTGVALIGVGGDFAYNFRPDLGLGGPDPIDPTAADYVRWARDHELDHWEAAPIDRSAVGIGIRAGLGDVASNGFLFRLDPIGLMVLVPGPVFVLGGAGKLINTSAIKAEGYLVVDIPSGSLAMGLGATVRYPPEPAPFALVDARGTFDALFSFSKPGIWYVHLGTEAAPIAAKVLKQIDADVYLELDADGVRFGAGIAIGGEWEFAIIKLVAKAGARVKAKLGYDPFQLEGRFQLWGELGISIWEFDFKIAADASAIGRLPNPTQLVFQVHYKLSLPWPLPDPEGTEELKIGEDPTPPAVAPALRSSLQAGPERLRLGALHAMTGRQWDLAATVAGGEDAEKQGYPWPDSEIVIPFTQPALDQTGTAINPFPGSTNQGGFDVTHTITKIELRNLIDDTVVQPLRGVWVAGPDGTTGRLHLLGTDPFAWLSPHTDVSGTVAKLPGGVTEQRFGYGAAEVLPSDARFGDVRLLPVVDAELLTSFQPGIATRVLRAREVIVEFRTIAGAPVDVDRVTLLLLAGAERGSVGMSDVGVSASTGPLEHFVDLGPVDGDLHLVAVDVRLGAPVDGLELFSAHREMPFHLVGVRYRRAERVIFGSFSKTLLVPARYRLTVEGSSEGHHPDPSVADPASVPWSQVQEFEVRNPPSLRPYIRMTTLGDPRVFGPVPGWDPTPIGLGFPAYRRYRPVVRFNVPYLHGIFARLRTRVAYHEGAAVQQDLVPTPAPDGTSSMPSSSQAWFATHGGAAPADEEVVVGGVLPAGGPAAVSLAFPLPDGREIRLDEWPATVSRFERFADHLAWPSTSVHLFYGPQGVWAHQPCDIPSAEADATDAWRDDDEPPQVAGTEPSRPWDLPAILAGLGWLITPYPDELTSPPIDWALPQSIAQEMAPLDGDTTVRFARFAWATRARFTWDGEPLAGIGDVTQETRIEVVGDDLYRPYAMWLRTPEPIDWRRVTASLRIEHVVPPEGCPTALAHRHPLDLDVFFIPGPDASSAFLVGMMGGIATRLPRGVYTLTLRFSPSEAGLPTLRPDPDVGAPETAVLRFVQPWGRDWPLPQDDVVVPHIFLEWLEWTALHPPVLDPGPLHVLFERAQRYTREAREEAIRAIVRAGTATRDAARQLPPPPPPRRAGPDIRAFTAGEPPVSGSEGSRSTTPEPPPYGGVAPDEEDGA